MSGGWESLNTLGCVTDTGETFFLPCEDNSTGDITIRLLDALQTESGGKTLYRPGQCITYFVANNVQEFAEPTPLELCCLPWGSPELNPTEECWYQLNQRLGNYLFEELDVLQDAALVALDSIEPPDVSAYLCP
jgi:hypothetical protein